MEQLIILEDKQFKEIQNDIKAIKEALFDLGKMGQKKKWLTSSESGTLLNVKIRTIYHYCQMGLLHPHKAAGLLLFDSDEIEALIVGK
jgi:hypothetical protein